MTNLLFLAFVGIGALLLLLFSLKYPRLMLSVFIFYTLLQDLSLYLTGAGFGMLASVDLLDELILLALTASWILRILVEKRNFRRTPIDGVMLLYGIYYALSVIWNQVALTNAALGFRDAVFYVLLFYALTQLDFGVDYLKKQVKFLLWMTYPQLVVLLVQWITFFVKTGSFFLEDEATGLMGPSGSHKLGYFAGTLFIAYLGFWREGVYKNKPIIIALLLVVVISSTRAVIFYIPIAVTILFGRAIWRSRRILLYWIGVFVGLLLVLVVYLALPETGRATLNPKVLYMQQSRETLGNFRYTRVGFFKLTYERLRRENMLFWGIGPGWYASKTASRIGSPYFQEFDDLPVRVDPTLSQVVLTLGEYGIVGSLLVFLLYLKLYLLVSKIHRKAREAYLRGLALAAKGSLIFYGLSAFSSNAFEIQQLSMVPWILVGSVFVLARQVKQESVAKKYSLSRSSKCGTTSILIGQGVKNA